MRFSLLIAIALLADPTPAFAHRLHVSTRLIGDQIRVEVFYDDDTPAQEAKVTIRLGDQAVGEGRTDDKGVWICPRPQPGTYAVRAESVGHAATEPLVVPEPTKPKPKNRPTPPTNAPGGREPPGAGCSPAWG
jgi:hypothetical protein